MREMIKMIVVLTAISIISGGALAFLERTTREPIEYQKLKFVKGPAVLAVLTGYDNDPIKDYRKDVVLEERDGVVTRKSIFPGKKGGKCFAVAFEVTGQGYGGPIGVIIGIDLKTGHLTGKRVTTHSETPGLGARSVEPGFYEQFVGLAPAGVALMDKGGKINAISGATTTTRGVLKAVRKGMELFSRTRDKIIGACQSG